MKGIFTSLSIREKGNTIWCFYTTKDNCRVPKCIKSFSGRCGVCSFSESPIILMVPCCNGLIYRRRGGGYMVVLTFQRQRRALLDALLRPWQSNVMESPIIVRLESLQRQMLRFSNSEDFINRYITQCSTI